MKKILMVILIASIVSPAFAFADNDKSERKGENKNNTQKSVQMAQKTEKKELKNEVKSFKKEKKKEYKEHKEEKKEIKKIKPRKVNYFFCVTATGWNVVPVDAYKDNNSANYLGEDCVKLPSSIAKRLQKVIGDTTATSTPDIITPIISGLSVSSVATTSATVSWNTNELATGKLWYGTSTPLTLYMQNTTPSLSHLFNLIGLTASTTYNLLIESVDGASNTATSTASLTTTN
ncbi:MAG TPA: hypothetical protein DCS23_02475 [Candidatus Yonathbacteria bacterium]|nr:hypothetical protein [Candidatus Yonathbacteria bacterium]